MRLSPLRSRRPSRLGFLAAALLASCTLAPAAQAQDAAARAARTLASCKPAAPCDSPLPVKVVVVSLFEIAAELASFTGFPKALEPPRVLESEQLSAMTFWHGARLTDWANHWVPQWTGGKGKFVTSAMEDTGILQAMTYLDAAGRADRHRVLVLRAGSNFTMPPPGTDAASYLLRENEGFAGLEAAVENLYTVGSVLVDELLGDWERYSETTP
ncbi:purine nucleoside permease [Novosphingobium profundi]|uniref:purine nucleoside permease n=1 Tax=Novosphingobium profundi TaxID=1774954 RepID=UPI001CFD4429|nr:purine nucleoside permease [Novosphingobium profundi]